MCVSYLQISSNGAVLFQNLGSISRTLGIQLCSQFLVFHSNDLCAQQGCIGSAIDSNGCYRNAGGHLDSSQQCIQAIHHTALAGNAHNRQSGVGSKGTSQVSCHTGSANQRTEAVCSCVYRKVTCFHRGSVGRINVNLIGDLKEQAMDAFGFDGETLELTPAICGSGSITVTIGNYLDDATRTETIYLSVPCAPMAEPTVLAPNTCTEDGLAIYRCHGHGINCETEFDEVVLPATGHQLFSVSQYLVKPTATQPGIGMGTCSRCGLIGVEQEVPPIFSDVVPDGFYSAPLDYCHGKGWVTGVTENTFAPGSACVRAQVVTFLWRAAGCPKPATKLNPFADVAETDFYYSAVLWAVAL